MKLTPSSTARRRTAIAAAGFLGGPQIPSPVIRMAPKPRRWIVSSPRSEIVPLQAADKVFISTVFSFFFILFRTPVLLLARSDRCHCLRTSACRDRISSRLYRQPHLGFHQA